MFLMLFKFKIEDKFVCLFVCLLWAPFIDWYLFKLLFQSQHKHSPSSSPTSSSSSHFITIIKSEWHHEYLSSQSECFKRSVNLLNITLAAFHFLFQSDWLILDVNCDLITNKFQDFLEHFHLKKISDFTTFMWKFSEKV